LLNRDANASPHTQVLGALDVLSVANLLNYFGCPDSAESIVLSPILLMKGTTKVRKG
jgi:hypothetical protein